jgi:hypothetical protein
MEEAFAADFADVRIHTGRAAALANHLLGSKAFAVGGDVLFAAEAFQPDTMFGRRLIAHELAHVVQKRLGHRRGGRWNERAAEHEAHAAAAAIAAGGRFRCAVPSAPQTISCWGEGGHYYTTHFILQAAGLDPQLAKDIAFFTQMGDEVSELDAVEEAGEWAMAAGKAIAMESVGPMVPLNAKTKIEYVALQRARQQRAIEIQRGLHCLTGASSSSETAWRAHYLETPSLTPDNLAIGLAVHAFGDSFAHRVLGNSAKMYSPVIGHGIEALQGLKVAEQGWSMAKAVGEAAGHAPDHLEQRPEIYQQYGEELYAIARYRWKVPLSKGISLAALRDCLKQICQIKGDDKQIYQIRVFAARLCKPIDHKYFPELKFLKGADEVDTVPYLKFQTLHGLPTNFLTRAQGYAKAWSYLSTRDPPTRKSKVSDYETAPQQQAQIHVVVAGDSLSGIAKRYYGKADQWPLIWNEPQNKKLIGNRPNLIMPGWSLVIPHPPVP